MSDDDTSEQDSPAKASAKILDFVRRSRPADGRTDRVTGLEGFEGVLSALVYVCLEIGSRGLVNERAFLKYLKGAQAHGVKFTMSDQENPDPRPLDFEGFTSGIEDRVRIFECYTRIRNVIEVRPADAWDQIGAIVREYPDIFEDPPKDA